MGYSALVRKIVFTRGALIMVICALLAALPARAEDVEKLIRECNEFASKPIPSGVGACDKLEAAVKKSTDQTALAKVALEAKYDSDARQAAVEKLTDQALLAKIAETGQDPIDRAKAVAAMDGSNPSLKRLAGSLEGVSSHTSESIARVKLAMQDPRIRGRFPRLVFTARVGGIHQGYGDSLAMPGEAVYFVLSQDGKTLAKGNWKTDFPQAIYSTVPSYTPPAFQGADVHGEEFLIVLLQNPVFTQDDLNALSWSVIPELRLAAQRAYYGHGRAR